MLTALIYYHIGAQLPLLYWPICPDLVSDFPITLVTMIYVNRNDPVIALFDKTVSPTFPGDKNVD